LRSEVFDILLKTTGYQYVPYTSSLLQKDSNLFFLARGDKSKYLVIVGESAVCGLFRGIYEKSIRNLEENQKLKIAPTTHENLQILRRLFPHLNPSPCSLKKSFGTGDRLGIATPAHVKAFEGKDIFPFFAQQSVRELERTRRNWEDVMDSAILGCFEAGYKGKFGADADHVKDPDKLVEAVECGYTMFTIDPSDFVRNTSTMSPEEKKKIYGSISERSELERRYLNRKYEIEGQVLIFDEDSLVDAIVTYFDALKFVREMYETLKTYKSDGFDFEVSVDETDTPTSPLAHIFIVEELRRMGVEFTNLALRFVGEWQKAIDYIGDLKKFEKEINLHAAIARHFGGYKLSLHSGSDKFSAYPAFSQATEGLFHVKTAGTSYLEAIRVIARKAPELYRKIHRFALERFQVERRSYHVTTDLSKIPDLDSVPDEKLEDFLNANDSRQLIHITYGAVLTARSEDGSYLFRDELYRVLMEHEKEHYECVGKHIRRHLEMLGTKR